MYPSLGNPSLSEAKFRLGFLDLGLDLDLGFSMLLLVIVVQPSAHLSCDTLQSVDE